MKADYSQPDFYRFNSDSIDLIDWLKKTQPRANSILDLGAGSGIIGIELANFLSSADITFVEVQASFMPFLKSNIESLLPQTTRFEILNCAFSEIPELKKFQLIVTNPPYYLPNEGELSENIQRRIARSFVVDGWDVLLSKVKNLLAKNGKCFVVILKNHRLINNVRALAQELRLNLRVHELAKVFILEISALDIE